VSGHSSVLEDRQAELAEALRVGEHVDFDEIFPRATVKPITERGRPSGSHDTIPAAPFASTGWTK
jgi:hypothetical protein